MHQPDDPRSLGDLIRFGTIATVDLAGARCTVRAGDLTSGPVRWIEGRAGATRSWSPPSVGEQVLLICAEGELAAGVALRGIGSAANPPPGNSTRELVRFADGAVIAYDPDEHALDAELPDGSTATIVASGGILLMGDVTIMGSLTVSKGVEATDDVTGKGVSLAQHKHGGVQAGSAQTGKPA